MTSTQTAETQNASNPYLSGFLAPVRAEVTASSTSSAPPRGTSAWVRPVAGLTW